MFSVGRDGVLKELEAIQAQLQTARPVVPDLPQFPPNWRDIRNPLPEMKSVSLEDAKRYLESNPQSHVKINFKDFTHINCGDSLQGTGLEGGSPEGNAALLGRYLERADLWDTKVDPVNLDRAKKLLLSLEDKRNSDATNQRQISDSRWIYVRFNGTRNGVFDY